MIDRMKTIGLIGGLSWYSTLEYYRVINELVQQRRGGHSSARIAMQSLDFAQIRQCQIRDDWAASARLLADAGRRCERAGADLVLICSNLMHRNADAVAAALTVPLLHIGDAIADRAARAGWSEVGLLGTRGVVEGEFYLGPLRAAGLDIRVPTASDRALVDRIIFDELTQGRVEEQSQAAYARIVGELAADGAQAVILGCTEIELLLRPEDSPVPLLDSMRVHAEAAVEAALTEPAGVVSATPGGRG